MSANAASLTADPRRTGDQTLDRLLRAVGPDSTVLDVGGGAGRYALPMALHGHHVTVVEPLPAMTALLRQGAADAGITNISVVERNWEDAQVEPADVVVCAHVVYGVTEIESFLTKLNASVASRVLILMDMVSPLTRFAPLWAKVHEEERINPPGLPELMNILWEMGFTPDLEMFPPAQDPPFVGGMEAARQRLRSVLYIQAGSVEDERLGAALPSTTIQDAGGRLFLDAPPRRQALISWAVASEGASRSS